MAKKKDSKAQDRVNKYRAAQDAARKAQHRHDTPGGHNAPGSKYAEGSVFAHERTLRGWEHRQRTAHTDETPSGQTEEEAKAALGESVSTDSVINLWRAATEAAGKTNATIRQEKQKLGVVRHASFKEREAFESLLDAAAEGDGDRVAEIAKIMDANGYVPFKGPNGELLYTSAPKGEARQKDLRTRAVIQEANNPDLVRIVDDLHESQMQLLDIDSQLFGEKVARSTRSEAKNQALGPKHQRVSDLEAQNKETQRKARIRLEALREKPIILADYHVPPPDIDEEAVRASAQKTTDAKDINAVAAVADPGSLFDKQRELKAALKKAEDGFSPDEKMEVKGIVAQLAQQGGVEAPGGGGKRQPVPTRWAKPESLKTNAEDIKAAVEARIGLTEVASRIERLKAQREEVLAKQRLLTRDADKAIQDIRMPEVALKEEVSQLQQQDSEFYEPYLPLPVRPRGYTVDEVYQGKDTSIEERKAFEGHEDPNGNPIDGWKKTLAFNAAQMKRNAKSVEDGTYYRGKRIWGHYGVDVKDVPAEKADVSVGPNKEYEVETKKFQLANPERDEFRKTRLSIPLTNFPTAEPSGARVDYEGTFNPNGDRDTAFDLEADYTPSDRRETSIRDVMKMSGIPSDAQVIVESEDRVKEIEGGDPGEKPIEHVHIITKEGDHINPDQRDEFLANLEREGFGVVHDGKTGKAQFSAEGPEMVRTKVRIPYAADKPKNLQEDQWVTEPVLVDKYDKTHNIRFGTRDQTLENPEDPQSVVSGALQKDQKDSVAIKIPGRQDLKIPFKKDRINVEERLVELNLQERSDGVGWGTSYRPGEKEIGHVVTAIPRARATRDLTQAIEKAKGGDDRDLDAFLHNQRPGDDKTARDKVKEELKIGADAATSAALYTGTKTARRKVVNTGYKKMLDTKLGKKANDSLGLKPSLWEDAQDTLGRDAADWYATKRAQVRHPFTDINNNVAGVEWDSGIRYRKHFFLGDAQDKRAARRDVELPRRQIEARFNARQEIHRGLSMDSGGGPIKWLDRTFATRQAHTIEGPKYSELPTEVVEHRLKFEGQLETHKQLQVDLGKLNQELENLKKANPKPDAKAARKIAQLDSERLHLVDTLAGKGANYEGELRASIQSLKNMEVKMQETPFSPEMLKKGEVNYSELRFVPKHAGKIALGVAGAVALTGAGVYGYDKYRQHYLKQDVDPIGKRLTDKHLPRSIQIPTASLQRTGKEKVPLNAVTSALDLEGKTYYRGVGLKTGKKNIYLRPEDRQDVTKETYAKGLPLIGGLSFRAPVKNDGSVLNSVFYDKTTQNRGYISPTGTHKLEVAGRTMPFEISTGKKERWNTTKGNKLKSINPQKSSASERDIIAVFGKYGTSADRERFSQLHHGDTKMQDLQEDDERFSAVNRRLIKSGAFDTPKAKARAESAKRADAEMKRLAATFSEGAYGEGETLEDFQAARAARRRADVQGAYDRGEEARTNI